MWGNSRKVENDSVFGGSKNFSFSERSRIQSVSVCRVNGGIKRKAHLERNPSWRLLRRKNVVESQKCQPAARKELAMHPMGSHAFGHDLWKRRPPTVMQEAATHRILSKNQRVCRPSCISANCKCALAPLANVVSCKVARVFGKDLMCICQGHCCPRAVLLKTSGS